jgi:hypothetical protein
MGCRLCPKYRYDDPADFATMPVSTKGMDDWKEYHDEQIGFSIKYPPNYFLDPKHARYLSLRQNTTGKGIRIRIWQLGRTSFSGGPIKLTEDTTVSDLERQIMAEDLEDRRPAVRRTCHRRKINGTPYLVRTKRAPGESSVLTSGIFEVYVFGIYDMADGKRFLVMMDNTFGGTPYTRDRKLRSDMLRVLHTLRWSHPKRTDDNATEPEIQEG